MTSGKDFDVAVIGYGPVGMAMAALLGRAGHRVVVLERYSGKYNLPRAAIFDDETMRTFARLGIADDLLPKVHAQRNYEWRNAAGELLIEHDFAEYGKSGWAEWYMMYQPDLEDALDAVCRACESVEVRFSSPVTNIEQSDDGVTLTIEGAAQSILSKYVIACDGGNSFVRRALDIPLDDYGFSEPWMVCDFRLNGRQANLPMARQVCDPAQPISIISLGPNHHRFSFMLGSDQDPEVERQPNRVWRRVEKYLRRDQATLIRAATYTFRSLVATRWRDRRILLAGDAAHQMPPFLGQGMCSGIRDAMNLSLKFDLLFAGAADAILDTYQTEREPHVRAVTLKGIELGRVQTMRDPLAAARRDRDLIARHQARDKPEKIAFPPLGPGLFGSGKGTRELFVQGFVRHVDRVDRFDAIAGLGNVVLIRAEFASKIRAQERTTAGRTGLKLAFIARAGTGGAEFEDINGTYIEWMDHNDCDAVAVRPDFHVWGTARGEEAVEDLIKDCADMKLFDKPATFESRNVRLFTPTA